jgi:hypothetical protein
MSHEHRPHIPLFLLLEKTIAVFLLADPPRVRRIVFSLCRYNEGAWAYEMLREQGRKEPSRTGLLNIKELNFFFFNQAPYAQTKSF